MIAPETREALRAALAGLADGDLSEQDGQDALKRLVPRLGKAIRNVGVGVAVPCAPGRSVVEETLACVARGLAFDCGISPLTKQSFEVANNREWLLHLFVTAGYRKLVFIDSDTVIDEKGVVQLLETMDKWKAAMVSALVHQRYVAADGVFNAFLRDGEDKIQPVLRKDIPQSLTAFPVEYCGIAAAVIDLDQIRAVNVEIEKRDGKKPTWFKRQADGFEHYSEDVHFCRMLKERGLDFVVDPKVETMHMIQHRFQYSPMVAK